MSDPRDYGALRRPRFETFRPLTKGIVSNTPTQAIPKEAFYDVYSYWPHERGLKRREAFREAFAGAQVLDVDLPPRQLVFYWDSSGDKQTLLLGRKYLYSASVSGGFTRIPWSFTPEGDDPTTGTLTDEDSVWHFKVAGLNFDDENVENGDVLILDPDDTGNGTEYLNIIGITTTDTTYDTLMLRAFPGPQNWTDGSTPEYRIDRTFRGSGDYTVDWVTVGGDIYFADKSGRGPLVYDGSTFEELEDDASLGATTLANMSAVTCVAHFDDRLWLGGMAEPGGDYRYRIRWSNKVNYDAFPAAQYLDLPYSHSEILRLIPLGNLLVAYFADAIFFGRVSNIVNQPVVFTRMDSGGVGLVGPRAITSWIDGHYFVGQDDIYFFSGSSALQRIGSPVLRRTIEKTNTKSAIQVTPDPDNNRIVFLFPISGTTEMWSFNYKTGGWTRDPVSASMITTTGPVERLSIGDLGETYADITAVAAAYPRIQEMGATVGEITFYRGSGGKVYKLIDAADAIPCGFESGDVDLDTPDMEKTFLRLGIKIDRVLLSGESVRFSVHTSHDRGRTWHPLDRDLVIGPNEDEGSVDFRETGSMFRFKVHSTSAVRSYIVEEWTLKYRLRGMEYNYTGGV